ncbi:MAG: hypothetical protein IJX13_07045 [Clostridia bacterium]|nr:hypothetical protein [Clostridia bacterium]
MKRKNEALLSPRADGSGRALFERLCQEAAAQPRHTGESGIGTLAEKRLHSIIKRYICEDEDLHEVGVANTRYVSDVRIGSHIYEIQTGAFYPMRKKIAHYMEKTDCTVTVVHPVTVNKFVRWIDPKTGDVSDRSRSPKHEGEQDLLPELYCLIPYLGHPRLRFRILLIEAEDFRLLNGWSKDRKRGSELYERIPLTLLGEAEFCKAEDFKRFLPKELSSPFTVKEFSKHVRLKGRDAYSAVRVLAALGLLRETQPIGRAMAFEKV